ncbi:MAG: DUF167 domain-containing protein [Myxococcales bacterium]|nr:DUF167 domain-containing protein [Myxococcales bacterium]
MSLDVREEGGVITFDVQVVPRASRDRIGPPLGDRIKVQLCAPPVDGAANDALRALLARALGVARGKVAIVRGETGRRKTVRVEGATRAALLALLGAP